MTTAINNEIIGNRITKPVHLDMTPMVDLGFLLITFFIFKSSITEQGIMKLVMPKESEILTPVPESKTLSVILEENNSLYYFHGNFKDASRKGSVRATRYDEVRRILQQKNQLLEKDLHIIIKMSERSSYKNFIDFLDELRIAGIEKYFVVDASEEEMYFHEKMRG